MSSQRGGTLDLLGEQTPRICSVPEYVSTSGDEAIELAAMAGLYLDPWQQFALKHSLGERADGKWAAFEVGMLVARQNGKGGFLEARELAGLYLLGERLIIHSAHLFDTSLEAFRRLLALIEDTPELDKRVARVQRSHGEEGIELKSRQRIRFRTRTAGGGRGFTGDCLILDEAMILPTSAHGALMPTLSARPNPQVVYAATAVDQEVHEHGVVLARIRERGMRGGDPSLAYFEWSVDEDEFKARPELATDVRAWGQANPGLGIRISVDHVANEQRSMTARNFATERLGVGDWPATDEQADRVIPAEPWRACADPASGAAALTFAIDTEPERRWSSITAAGARSDGLMHGALVVREPGTGWVVERCKALAAEHPDARFVVDKRGPAASLIPDLIVALGVTEEQMKDRSGRLLTTDSAEYSVACGRLLDMIVQEALRYRPDPLLDGAADGAKTRPLGDAWAWSRKNSKVDITPLVALTLAVWGAQQPRKVVEYARVLFTEDLVKEPKPGDWQQPGRDAAGNPAGPMFRVLSQEDTTTVRFPPRK